MSTRPFHDPGRGRKRPTKRGSLRLKPLPEDKVFARMRKELRAMTPEQFLQSLVDTGIFTPRYRLRAPYRRLEKEGYVYAPKGMRPEWLTQLKQLSRQLQQEARRSRQKAVPRPTK
jgi:hypothetical protein